MKRKRRLKGHLINLYRKAIGWLKSFVPTVE